MTKGPGHARGRSELRHIGIIGFGAIARDLCGCLMRSGGPALRVTVLLRADSASKLSLPPGVGVVSSVSDLVEAGPDIVVEAAGHQAVHQYGLEIVSAGIPLILTSTGALESEALVEALDLAARKAGTAWSVPSGAIGGIDYARTLRFAKNPSIRYTSRKPIAAWESELDALGVVATSIQGEFVLFEGSAAEAALRYPRNLNVAATLALAGIGMEKTRVRVVADSTASMNTHEIDFESEFGRARLMFENSPSPDNPKTSMIVVPSICDAIERHFEFRSPAS
jgi:aspartate dehydrogenase